VSLIVEVKTASQNGLPIRTLEKTLKRYEMELVESVEWSRRTRAGYMYYNVTMHESVNPETEAKGR
jgi:hypothetical protein